MKKCVLLLILIVASVAIKAQTYMGGGLNFGLSSTNLNNVIDEYNRSRSYLTVPMSHIGWMRGGHARVGYISDKGGAFELNWSGQRKVVYAEGVDATNELVRREIKMKNNMLSVGGGYIYPHGIIKPGILLFLDLGNIKTYTRSGPADEVSSQDFNRVDKTLQAGLTIAGELMIRFGRKSPVALSVRPYYQLQLIEADYFDLNMGLNPNTWFNLEPEDVSSANSHFGIQGALVFIVGDKESKKSNYTAPKQNPTPAPKQQPKRGDIERINGGGR